VGGKLQSAMLLRRVDPVYPALAREMRIEGTVRFQAVIGKEGEVQNLKYVSGPQALEKAAADAVKQWVYRPTLLDGRPVEVSTQIEIGFNVSR
jgi:protein TonB